MSSAAPDGLPRPSPGYGLLYRLLTGTYRWAVKIPGARQAWGALWRWSEGRYTGPIRTRLYGQEVVVNNGNDYPLVLARHPGFNEPIVLAFALAAGRAGRPIAGVDVGLGLGDTALLLLSRLGKNQLAHLTCLDGEAGFLALARANLSAYGDRVTCRQAMLAAAPMEVPSLLREHGATAHAAGPGTVSALPLDSVMAQRAMPIGALKIDVDGYDGRVLAGAAGLLASDRPIVIFEWHPELYARTGGDVLEPFAALARAGYDRLVWFRNTGSVSHLTPCPPDPATTLELARLCQQRFGIDGYHFDVLALPAEATCDLATSLTEGRWVPA